MDWQKTGKQCGLEGQTYRDWGYDTTQMIFDLIVNGAVFESFNNSEVDIVTIDDVDAMEIARETDDFTRLFPPP